MPARTSSSKEPDQKDSDEAAPLDAKAEGELFKTVMAIFAHIHWQAFKAGMVLAHMLETSLSALQKDGLWDGASIYVANIILYTLLLQIRNELDGSPTAQQELNKNLMVVLGVVVDFVFYSPVCAGMAYQSRSTSRSTGKQRSSSRGSANPAQFSSTTSGPMGVHVEDGSCTDVLLIEIGFKILEGLKLDTLTETIRETEALDRQRPKSSRSQVKKSQNKGLQFREVFRYASAYLKMVFKGSFSQVSKISDRLSDALMKAGQGHGHGQEQLCTMLVQISQSLRPTSRARLTMADVAVNFIRTTEDRTRSKNQKEKQKIVRRHTVSSRPPPVMRSKSLA